MVYFVFYRLCDGIIFCTKKYIFIKNEWSCDNQSHSDFIITFIHDIWGVGVWCSSYTNSSCHVQQYFSYIVPASFIGGGNRSTRKKKHRPLASHSQNLSHNVVSSTPRHERGSNSKFSGDRHWLICSCNSNYATYDHEHDGESFLLNLSIFGIKYYISTSVFQILFCDTHFNNKSPKVTIIGRLIVSLNGLIKITNTVIGFIELG